MSNGVVTSGCCCNQECASDCCSWWSCSPTAPINVVLSGSAITNKKILPGTQVLLLEEIYWTITATLTRSGSTCTPSGAPPYNTLYRYSAQTCNFSYQKKIYFRDVGESYTCLQLRWSPLFCGAVTVEGDCMTWANPSVPFSGWDIGVLPCYDGVPPCSYYWTCPGASGCSPPTYPGTGCLPCAQNSDILAGYSSCQAYYDINGVWPEPSPRTGPNPCLSWNCCFGGNCADSNTACSETGCEGIRCPSSPDEIEFRLQSTLELTYNGNLTGSGTCGNDTCIPDFGNCPNSIPGPAPFFVGPPSVFVRSGDVITIVCVETQCKADAECVKPVLIFSPDTAGKFLDQVLDKTMDPCCPWPCGDPKQECLVESQVSLCIKPFAIFGKSACLNASTFDDPITGCSMHPSPVYGFGDGGQDMAGIGCSPCQPLNQTLEFPPYCNGGSNDPEKQGDSPYFCSVYNEGDLYCPEGCACDNPPGPSIFCPPSDCTSKPGGEIRRCHWPGWCEMEERTTVWTWTM